MTQHTDAEARDARCPQGMAYVDATMAEPAYCIDRWEGSLVESGPAGEKAFSPYESVAGHKVRAVTKGGVVPQAYISRNEAHDACVASRKRLCTETEWVRACEGAQKTTFPYGEGRKAGYCNDHGRAPLATLYAGNGDAHSYEPMNDPRLNQLPGTVAKTGQFTHCKSSYGAFDMVGNVHEWVDDPSGTFRGGYYLDTSINGEGCNYKTVAHDAAYHDYSTGFRCCADAR
jgi:formylglycine-generating enzyme required for sulfatase activity